MYTVFGFVSIDILNSWFSWPTKSTKIVTARNL